MAKRIPLIAGNWKCHKTIPEAVELAAGVVEGVEGIVGVETALCPPFVDLPAVREQIAGSAVRLGAQNVYPEEGAYTGEIAPRMLVDLCHYVILGHSERRHVFGESDELIRKKMEAVLDAGLAPILCVGETLEENEADRTEEVVSSQVRSALDWAGARHFIALGGVVAYEPVWAIGTGKPCHGPVANEIIGMIRGLLGDLFGGAAAEAVRIQYGGSVKPSNVDEFMTEPQIDGALVGGASLKAEDFVQLVRRTAELRAAGE